MSQIRQAVDDSDAQGLRESAHTLKGAVGNIGAKGAFEAAFNLETIARVGEMSQAREACETLEKEISGLVSALETLVKEQQGASTHSR